MSRDGAEVHKHINTAKKNEANIQSSWPNKLGLKWRIYIYMENETLLSCGTQQIILSRQDSAILPAWVANYSIWFILPSRGGSYIKRNVVAIWLINLLEMVILRCIWEKTPGDSVTNKMLTKKCVVIVCLSICLSWKQCKLYEIETENFILFPTVIGFPRNWFKHIQFFHNR